MPWESNDKAGVFVLGIQFEAAAVFLNDSLRHGKPKPCSHADFFGGEERLEDSVANLEGNSAAAVGDVDQHFVRARFYRKPNPLFFKM